MLRTKIYAVAATIVWLALTTDAAPTDIETLHSLTGALKHSHLLVNDVFGMLSRDERSERLRKVIPSDALNLILETCKTTRDCRQQRQATKDLRKGISRLRKQERLKLHGDDKKAQDEADALMAKIQLAKESIFAAAGLSKDLVQPADDRVWQGDALLSNEQAEFLIQMAKTGVASRPSEIKPPLSRLKRFGLYYPAVPYLKWAMPVKYTFGAGITEAQKVPIRQAVAEIASKSCTRFQEMTSVSGPHIDFVPYSGPDVCGLSNVGMQATVNSVYINFGCTSPPTVAIIIHEVLHVLGFMHTQERIDRDLWITIQWPNVDPQHYDIFNYANADYYSSHGTPYDYFSVMHYNAAAGSVNGQPTMIPTLKPSAYFQAKLGQAAHMSIRDAETLNKMYCKPDCQDNHPHCGVWANYYGSCDASKGYFDYMEQTCKMSCYFC